MSKGLNRREMLKGTGLATAALLASPLFQWASAQGSKTRKILFFSRSQGFEHTPVTRPKKTPEKLSLAEEYLVALGKENNFEVTCTKDGSVFTPEGLAPFDVIMFYTTGLLDQPLGARDLASHGEINNKPMPAGGKQALLDAVAGGKGFLGLHCATDTFHSKGGTVDPYIQMIGGEFVHHGAQQESEIQAVTSDFGSIKGLETFKKHEEWYILKNIAPDMQVLLVQNTKSMREKEYTDLAPYPETWARNHGKGRVFYSSLGHRCSVDANKDHKEDIWSSEVFKKVLLGGLQWTSGNVEAEVKPNAKQVTPDAKFRAADKSA